MDIYAYIEKDHRAVADLMQQVLDTRDAKRRMELFNRIRTELILHLDSEEVTFYRAVERASRARPLEEQMSHAEDEHQEARDYLMKLSALEIHDELWIETFGEFKHAVSHHVKEEETEVWKKAKKLLSDADAEKLADEMAAVKQEMKDNPPLPGNLFDKPDNSLRRRAHI